MPTPQLRLERADFPADPFGYDHAINTSMLCEEIGKSLGLSGDELLLARATGMFHDLGRKGNWWEATSHAIKSAELAEFALKDDADWLALPGMIQRMGKIIANHNIHGTPPKDPIAISLWDADLMESCRLAPGTSQGMKIMQHRFAKLISPLARNPEFQAMRVKNRLQKAGAPWTPEDEAHAIKRR